MPRVPPIEPGTQPALRDIEAAILAERGRVSLLYRVLLNSAPVAGAWEKLLTAVRHRSVVPADLRELAILRVAVLNRAAYEFDAHVPHALAAGLTQMQVDAVRRWPAVDAPCGYTDDQALVLELADAMTRQIDVADALMARVQARFDARGTVELVVTLAAYNMVSRVLVALQIGQ